MRHKYHRCNPLRRLIFILIAILVVLCACAVMGNLYLNAKPAPGTVEEQVWLYAKENGFSLRDYPESLISLLKRNPEAEQFVLQYPSAKDNAPAIDMKPYLNTENVPLFLQWDPRWGYMTYGSDVAGLTGCGPVCLAMAAIYVTDDPAFSPDNMIRFAAENNYYVSGSGSSWTLISEGAAKLGFDVTELPLVKGRIFSNLEAGNPVICVMGPGDFTTTGHFVVMTGLEDGYIRINDPNSIANSQKLWRYEDIEGQIRNLWAIRN